MCIAAGRHTLAGGCWKEFEFGGVELADITLLATYRGVSLLFLETQVR